MSELRVAGCLACGAMGDIPLDEIETAECYSCGQSKQFMIALTSEMDVKFVEEFFTARLTRMSKNEDHTM